MTAQDRQAQANQLFLAGLAYDRQGQTARAEQSFREALKADPRHADSLFMLGTLHARRGDHAEAARLIGGAIAVKPDYPDYHYNLAKVMELAGQYGRAEQAYLQALRLDGRHYDALLNLSHLMLFKPDFEAAARFAVAALAIRPESVGALNNLGLASMGGRHFEQAEKAFTRALGLDPRSADTLVNLAVLYKRQERYEESIARLREAVAISPSLPAAYNNLGSVLKFEGRLREALAYSRKALEIAPDAGAHSNLLFNLSYHPEATPEEIFREHQDWARKYAQGLDGAYSFADVDRGPERVLRVGYVSADFKNHAMAYFLRPLIGNHDPARVAVHCYSAVTTPDETTAWFRERPVAWRDIAGLTEQQVADTIHADRIDILIDLAGHTAGNRLLVFARRPAPVQMSYLGYLGSTGLASIDYRITDAISDPPGETERFHTETLARLPRSMWCYSPPDDAPDVAPLPCLGKGHVTFASFNNSAKVSPEVVAAWARILNAVPGARLLMTTKGEGSVHEYFRAEFGRHGIGPDRLELRRRMPLRTYLELHGEVDIALDPFPYTGGATTCHALWMGVPVLTLPGSRPYSRSAASILDGLGLADWIAGSVDDYVAKACAKAVEVEALRDLRAGLRTRMQASPVMDGKGFAASMEQLYREAWRQYCVVSAGTGA